MIRICEVGGVFLVAGGDRADVFQPAEEAFDAVAAGRVRPVALGDLRPGRTRPQPRGVFGGDGSIERLT